MQQTLHRTTGQSQKRLKKSNEEDLVPVVFAHVRVNSKHGDHKQKHDEKCVVARTLLDSGCSTSAVSDAVISTKSNAKKDSTAWTAAAGAFKTAGSGKLHIKTPESSETALVEHTFQAHDGSIGQTSCPASVQTLVSVTKPSSGLKSVQKHL